MNHFTRYFPSAPPAFTSPGRSLVLCLLPLLLLAGRPAALKAQRRGHFTANGRHVDVRAFNREVEKIMLEIQIPAMSLAIIDNNQVVFYHTYGHKESSTKQQVNKRTVFEACSLSKTYLAFVAHKLADAGKLDLDKPLHEYLKFDAAGHDPRAENITARMVLSHSSGLENWRHQNNPDTLEFLKNPGEGYVYSGEGYEYLAKVIQRILQKPYAQYIDEMVIKPLALKNSYVVFRKTKFAPGHRYAPWNYASGHGFFGNTFAKSKNFTPRPAARNHITAEDYAKLVIAFFDGKHFSENAVRGVLQPIVRTTEKDNPFYYTPGFELFYGDRDTIIGHGGDNMGFKAHIFYSVVSRSGFVVMTNSDRGKLITSKISEMSVGLEVRKYWKEFYIHQQYPSAAISLLKTYRDEDSLGMFREMEKPEMKAKMDAGTRSELAFMFYDEHVNIAKKLLEESIRLHPEVATAYCLLGGIALTDGEYDLAYRYFTKAKALKFDWWELESSLAECQQKKKESIVRKAFSMTIAGNEASLMEAENYNLMRGIELVSLRDPAEGQGIGYVDAGDWLDYRVDVPAAGTYSVAFRVAAAGEKAQFQVRLGTTVLATVDVKTTNGWDNWTTVKSDVELPAGSQTLRLYATRPGFNVNWLEFSPAQLVSK